MATAKAFPFYSLNNFRGLLKLLKLSAKAACGPSFYPKGGESCLLKLSANAAKADPSGTSHKAKALFITSFMA